jgi:hypothetical protein
MWFATFHVEYDEAVKASTLTYEALKALLLLFLLSLLFLSLSFSFFPCLDLLLTSVSTHGLQLKNEAPLLAFLEFSKHVNYDYALRLCSQVRCLSPCCAAILSDDGPKQYC